MLKYVNLKNLVFIIRSSVNVKGVSRGYNALIIFWILWSLGILHSSAIVAKCAGVIVGDALTAIGIAESVLPLEAEACTSNTTRNILSKTPAGQEVVIGQEVHIKYFSDSGRTNLVGQKSTVFLERIAL